MSTCLLLKNFARKLAFVSLQILSRGIVNKIYTFLVIIIFCIISPYTKQVFCMKFECTSSSN